MQRNFLNSTDLKPAGVFVLLLVAAILAIRFAADGSSTARRPRPEGVATSRPGETIVIMPSKAYGFTELRVSEVDSKVHYASLQGTLHTDGSRLLRFVWSVNDQEVSRGKTLSPHHFSRGDLVEVKLVEANNSGKPRTLDRANIIILNSPPVIRSVVLQRTEDDPLQLEAITDVFDPDDDAVLLTYVWTINGRPFRDAEGSAVSLEGISRGRNLNATVVASDGRDRSTPHVSRPFRVDNQAPGLEVREAELLSNASDDSDETWAALQVRSTDPDGDIVSVELIDPPADVRWESAARRLVWRVQDGSQTITVRIRATDGRGASVERDLQLSR